MVEEAKNEVIRPQIIKSIMGNQIISATLDRSRLVWKICLKATAKIRLLLIKAMYFPSSHHPTLSVEVPTPSGRSPKSPRLAGPPSKE